MKLKKVFSKVLMFALIVQVGISFSLPITAYAQENNNLEKVLDDGKIRETVETITNIKEFTSLSEQRTVLYGTKLVELEVGETIVIGSDSEGIISIKCVNENIVNTTRAGFVTSNKQFDIYKTILGIETLLASVNLECTWYKNGVDGYIQNLRGTYTEKNFAWNCSWDSTKYSSTYTHTLFLNLSTIGSSYSIMFSAHYNGMNETLSFNMST